MAERRFSLFDVTIDLDPESRIDKYREHEVTATSLHPATLKDGGNLITVIAKVTAATSVKALERLRDCAEIHRSLDEHPAVIKIFGVKRQDTYFALLMEKAECSLRDIITPNTPEKVELRRRLLEKMSLREVIQQMVYGLAYIHSRTDDVNNHISHRDLKPENLLATILKRDGSFAIKFTDFDSAKQMDGDESVNVSSVRLTPLYLDPHVSQKKDEGETVTAADYLAADVFSLGLVAYELLTSTHLFKGKTNRATLRNMEDNNRTNLFEATIDELFKNAIMAMTQENPEDRPTAEEITKEPCFWDENDHLQHFNAVNEAIIDLDDSPESQAIKAAVNESFFMVFKKLGKGKMEKWKKFPFVIDSILSRSKYNDTLIAFLRFCRNLVVHAGQHKDALEKHFGTTLSSEELLNEILKPDACPRLLIHLYWVAKCHLAHLPQLKFLENFSSKSCNAYVQLMEVERKAIGEPALSELYATLCQTPESPVTAVDENAIVEDAFCQFHKQIVQVLNKTESDFKPYKEDAKKRENDQSRLEKKIANLTKNGRPQAEIDATKTQLDALKTAMEAELPCRWMLDFRDDLRKSEKYRESKSRNDRVFSSIFNYVFSLVTMCNTAEPAYSYIVYSRFLAIVELNLVPFTFISVLFYPCYSRLLL